MKNKRFSCSNLETRLDPPLKSISQKIKPNLFISDLKNKPKKSQVPKKELEKYKQNLLNKTKPSPIIKASSNIDEFYKSIKPSKLKLGSSTNREFPPGRQQEFLLSFCSNISKGELRSENISKIISREKLDEFQSSIDSELISAEDEE